MGLLDDAIREHLELKRRRGADAVEISRLESEALGPVRRSATGVPDLSEGTTAEPTAAEPAVAEPATAEPPAESARTDRRPWEDSTSAAGGHDPSPAPSAHQSPPVSTSPTAPAYPAATPTPPPTAYEQPPVLPAAPPEPPSTSILRPPPIDPEPMQPAEPEESPAAGEPDEPAPSLLSRFKPARRRHARESARDEPPAAFAPPAEPAPADHDPSPYATPPPPAHEPDVVPAKDEPDPEELLEETPEFLEETPEHDRLWFEQRPPRDFDFDG